MKRLPHRPKVEYARCTTCELVTPQSFVRWPSDNEALLPVELCGAQCGTWRTVSEQADLYTELDAVAVHASCETHVACPSAAHIVRCPSTTHVTDPGTTDAERLAVRLFPGPALMT